jgi:hypothetical protein
MRAITACRTATLGGHLLSCDRCGASLPVYNSCRNRHCPKCQTLAKERWLEARQNELLPIDYFHVVFTLPHEIHSLAAHAPRWVYAELFRSAASTLLDFGDDPRWLGGQIGLSAILHTWGQTLARHVHVHAVVTGGALSRDRARWIPARPGFLFPVKALAVVFRTRFVDALRHGLGRGEIATPADLDADALIAALYAKDWVVYSKRPFAGPRSVLDYLGRYTHRIGITNDRLLDFDGDTVRFRYRDYRDDNKTKVLALDTDEFLRRFLMHVLPRGFTRIRHYGLLASRDKTAKITRCLLLLGRPPPPPSETLSARELMLRITRIDIERCPVCRRGRLVRAQTLPRRPFPPRAARAPPADGTT